MHNLYTSDTPASIVKNAEDLHLLTANTGNGQAVQIFLEELALVYRGTWTTTLIDIWSNEQEKEWFLRLNPNGRVPVLIDGNFRHPPIIVHGSSACLQYLFTTADSQNKFGFEDEFVHSEVLQWLFFWDSSGAPCQRQLMHFTRVAPEKTELSDVITRFRDETLRAFGVLEIRLSGKYTGEPRDYLVGKEKGEYTIADIETWTWVNHWENCGITKEEMDGFPHLLKWIGRIAERPAVQTGSGSKYNLWKD
ncbi:glutathione S-transferase [Nemania abortiva]|nr:glutathione S-transferase [Nemania abortiva]